MWVPGESRLHRTKIKQQKKLFYSNIKATRKTVSLTEGDPQYKEKQRLYANTLRHANPEITFKVNTF